jgi:hypothetical protein
MGGRDVTELDFEYSCSRRLSDAEKAELSARLSAEHGVESCLVQDVDSIGMSTEDILISIVISVSASLAANVATIYLQARFSEVIDAFLRSKRIEATAEPPEEDPDQEA